MHTVCSICGRCAEVSDLARMEIKKVDDALIKKSTESVKAEFERLGGDDQVAKGTSLLDAVKKQLRRAG